MRRPLAWIPSVTLTACISVGPPAAPPERALPLLSESPPPPVSGRGRVAFDAVDAPAAVNHVTSSGSAFATSGLNSAYASSREESFVCATPCVVNLPYGEYRMRFTQKSGSSSPWREYWADVRVGPEPKVVRVDMHDTYRQSSGAGFGSLALMVLGGATAMTGGGLAAAEIEGGAAVGLVGAAALIGGIILMVATQTEVFPGNETQWAPADQRIFTR